MKPVQKMSVDEMRMPTWISGNKLKNRIRNYYSWEIGIGLIESKISGNLPRWFGLM